MAAKTSSYKGNLAASKNKKRRKNAMLTITNGCFAGLKINIKRARTFLGRDLKCDICLDSSLVSDEHAIIRNTAEGYIIEDLNSRNGLGLNGKATTRGKLRHGDTISIGNFKLKFSCKAAKQKSVKKTK